MATAAESIPRVSLDVISIASPCHVSWDKMTGDERVRFCADCKLRVYNISEMAQSEAEEFLGQQVGRVCVRFFRRSDGTILTQDCPVGLRLIRRGIAATLTAIASLVSLLVGLCTWRSQEAAAEQPIRVQLKAANIDLSDLGDKATDVETALYQFELQMEFVSRRAPRARGPLDRLSNWVHLQSHGFSMGAICITPSTGE